MHHNISAQGNTEPMYLDELIDALEYNRKTRIIWAHVGISRRMNMEELLIIAGRLLNEHPNLCVDISWLVFDEYIRGDRFQFEEKGILLDMWAALIERYPTRFMIGSDKVGHWSDYPGEIVKYYDLLDRLKPETVAKVCRENALSIVKKY